MKLKIKKIAILVFFSGIFLASSLVSCNSYEESSEITEEYNSYITLKLPEEIKTYSSVSFDELFVYRACVLIIRNHILKDIEITNISSGSDFTNAQTRIYLQGKMVVGDSIYVLWGYDNISQSIITIYSQLRGDPYDSRTLIDSVVTYKMLDRLNGYNNLSSYGNRTCYKDGNPRYGLRLPFVGKGICTASSGSVIPIKCNAARVTFDVSEDLTNAGGPLYGKVVKYGLFGDAYYLFAYKDTLCDTYMNRQLYDTNRYQTYVNYTNIGRTVYAAPTKNPNTNSTSFVPEQPMITMVVHDTIKKELKYFNFAFFDSNNKEFLDILPGRNYSFVLKDLGNETGADARYSSSLSYVPLYNVIGRSSISIDSINTSVVDTVHNGYYYNAFNNSKVVTPSYNGNYSLCLNYDAMMLYAEKDGYCSNIYMGYRQIAADTSVNLGTINYVQYQLDPIPSGSSFSFSFPIGRNLKCEYIQARLDNNGSHSKECIILGDVYKDIYCERSDSIIDNNEHWLKFPTKNARVVGYGTNVLGNNIDGNQYYTYTNSSESYGIFGGFANADPSTSPTLTQSFVSLTNTVEPCWIKINQNTTGKLRCVYIVCFDGEGEFAGRTTLVAVRQAP